MAHIRSVALEEILKLESLENKEFLVRKVQKPAGIEILFKASKDHEIYAGSRQFPSKEFDQTELDSDGMPYFRRTLGPISCQIYDPIFIRDSGDLSKGSIMSEILHLSIFSKIEAENHPVYQEFIDDMKQLIEKLPLIKEAKYKEKFFNDVSGLEKFSKAELEIYESVIELYDKNSQAIYGKNPLAAELDPNFDKEGGIGFIYLKIAFGYWYRHHIISKGYEKKIEDPLQKWFNRVVETLEIRGFKRVEKFGYQQ